MEQKHHFTGLTDKEVIESREKYGENVLTPPEKDPLWKQFISKFADPLIIVLLIAGAASVGISLYEYFGLGHGPEVFFEPVGIFVAIFWPPDLPSTLNCKPIRNSPCSIG